MVVLSIVSGCGAHPGSHAPCGSRPGRDLVRRLFGMVEGAWAALGGSPLPLRRLLTLLNVVPAGATEGGVFVFKNRGGAFSTTRLRGSVGDFLERGIPKGSNNPAQQYRLVKFFAS